MLVVLSIIVMLGLLVWMRRVGRSKALQIINLKSGRFAGIASERVEPPVDLLEEVQTAITGQTLEVSSADLAVHHNVGQSPLNRAWAVAGVGGALVEPMRNSAFYGQFQTWNDLNSLDSHVFEGFSALARRPVENLADLRSVISERAYNVDTEGFVSSLKGHAAEAHVNEHLMESGHEVGMSFDPNQPGYDLIVDGQEFNVKLYKDAAQAIAKHAEKYPDIGVIVPGDAANIPENAVHLNPGEAFNIPNVADGEFITLVDHALSYLDVDSNTRSVLAMAQDEGISFLEDGTLDFEGLDLIDGLPLITIAISSFREAKLLLNDDTDMIHATKNIAIDAAGVGTGAFAGAKAGALFGSVIPGPGTIIGGAIGGMAGAVAGRMMSNSFKQAPLRRAQEDYEAKKQLYLEQEANQKEYAEEAWNTAFANEQADLSAEANRIRWGYEAAVRDLQEIVESASIVSKDEASQILKSLHTTCLNRREHLAAEFAQMPILERIMGHCGHGARAQIYFRYKRDLWEWEDQVESLLHTWVDSPEATERFFDLALAITDDESLAVEFVDTVQGVRVNAVSNVNKHYKNLASRLFYERQESEKRLIETMDDIRVHVEMSLEGYINGLTTASEAVRMELARLGKA